MEGRSTIYLPLISFCFVSTWQAEGSCIHKLYKWYFLYCGSHIMGQCQPMRHLSKTHLNLLEMCQISLKMQQCIEPWNVMKQGTLDDSHHTGTSEIVQQLKVFPHDSEAYVITIFFINTLFGPIFSFLCCLQCSLQHF